MQTAMNLREQLMPCLRGRVCFIGMGNVNRADEGFGVRLAERLRAIGIPNVMVAGATPERWIGRLADPGFDHVIFLDAVEFGAKPGSARILGSSEISPLPTQVSAGKISLGTLSRWVEASGATKAWLLAVQPESLKVSENLSSVVQESLERLSHLLYALMIGHSAEPGLKERASLRTDGRRAFSSHGHALQ